MSRESVEVPEDQDGCGVNDAEIRSRVAGLEEFEPFGAGFVKGPKERSADVSCHILGDVDEKSEKGDKAVEGPVGKVKKSGDEEDGKRKEETKDIGVTPGAVPREPIEIDLPVRFLLESELGSAEDIERRGFNGTWWRIGTFDFCAEPSDGAIHPTDLHRPWLQFVAEFAATKSVLLRGGSRERNL